MEPVNITLYSEFCASEHGRQTLPGVSDDMTCMKKVVYFMTTLTLKFPILVRGDLNGLAEVILSKKTLHF